MSTYPQGVFNKLPTKISRKDFNRYIAPYLTEGRRGPDTKISKYKIFNYIMRVLHTGMQWDELEIYKNEIHWSNIYRWHNKWSRDGSYESLFESSVQQLSDSGKLDLSVLHGDGSNTVAKKGARS
ncbi:MAG: transposase [Candidatus Saccharimonadales bacterium]